MTLSVQRAITVQQPWAMAIADRLKPIENRVQPTTHRGLIGIHSGLAVDDNARLPTAEARSLHAMLLRGRDRLWDARVPRLGREPDIRAARGAVIAVADLVECHKAIETPRLSGDLGTCCEPWGNGTDPRTHHYVLENVQILTWPVPCRGALGVWRLPEDVSRQVTGQLRRVWTCRGDNGRCVVTVLASEGEARAGGWRLGQRPSGELDAMCPGCGAPDPVAARYSRDLANRPVTV